jgi:hypothetical protein
MPIVYGICFFFIARDNTDLVNPPAALTSVYLLASYSKGILLFIAAIFLGDSMRRIRKAVSAVNQDVRINQEIFIAHLVVLVFYLISVVLFYVAWTEGVINYGKPKYMLVMFRLWDTTTFLNVLQ